MSALEISQAEDACLFSAPIRPLHPRHDISSARRDFHANVEYQATLWEIAHRAMHFLDMEWPRQTSLF
jgi:hypothetical protein